MRMISCPIHGLTGPSKACWYCFNLILPDSFSFEHSGNELASVSHNQLFSQVILASPAAFHGEQILKEKSIFITPIAPKINYQNNDSKNQTNTINS